VINLSKNIHTSSKLDDTSLLRNFSTLILSKQYKKYEKILRVGNWLIFISPNVETRDKIKMYFLDFLNERIYNGRDGFVQAGKKYIFLSIADLQNNPDIIYTSMMHEN